MVHTKSRAVNLILPVGVALAHFHILGNTRHGRCESSELVQTLCCSAYGIVGRIVELRLALRTFLCCNHDDAIGCTRTVNGSSRSVLQNRKGLNVIRIDTTDKIGSSLNGRVVYRNTVYHNQRIVGR